MFRKSSPWQRYVGLAGGVRAEGYWLVGGSWDSEADGLTRGEVLAEKVCEWTTDPGEQQHSRGRQGVGGGEGALEEDNG